MGVVGLGNFLKVVFPTDIRPFGKGLGPKKVALGAAGSVTFGFNKVKVSYEVTVFGGATNEVGSEEEVEKRRFLIVSRA